MPSTERKTTAYDRNFEQLLMDDGTRNTGWEGNYPSLETGTACDACRTAIMCTDEDHDVLGILYSVQGMEKSHKTKTRTTILPLPLRKERIANEQENRMSFLTLELSQKLSDSIT